MNRILITVTALFAVVASAADAQTTSATLRPAASKAIAQTAAISQGANSARFTNPIRVPVGPASFVSATECNRRAVGVWSSGEAMSVNGASDSRTLIAIPIAAGGASAAGISSATTQQQISDVCEHN